MDGTPNLLLPRTELVSEIVQSIVDVEGRNPFTSLYYRAPMGSGKTILLQLIGQKLVDMGLPVIFLDAGDLRRVSKSDLQMIDTACASAQTTGYMLIDEVQRNFRDSLWVYLLREARHLRVVGCGVPDLAYSANAFKMRMSVSDVFFTSRDFDEECVDKLVALWGPTHLSAVTVRSVVQNLINSLLSYTAGHGYPMLMLLEHFIVHDKKACMEGTCLETVSNQSFWDSKCGRSIHCRTLQFHRQATFDAFDILKSKKGSTARVARLDKFGWWDFQRDWFPSDLIEFAFARRQLRGDVGW